MSKLYINDTATLAATSATATATSASEWVAPLEHDQLLVETGVITVNSGTGSVTPKVLFAPVSGGTFTTLWEGDSISATTSAPTRAHLTDISFVLPGVYKLSLEVSGTINYTGTMTAYAARRAVKP